MEKYRITSTKFIGYNAYGDGSGSYTYEISFNRSLEHTGKYKGIEDGLNKYDKIEPWKEAWKSLTTVFRYIRIGFKRLFR